MIEKVLACFFGGGIIALGIYNLAIWRLIKKEASIIKAKLVERFHVRHGSVYGQQGCVIEYTVNDVQYRERIIVTKKAPIYDGTIGEEYDVYVVEKYPKVVVGSIDKNWFIIGLRILLIFSVLFIILREFL